MVLAVLVVWTQEGPNIHVLVESLDPLQSGIFFGGGCF